jgi:hypothetical protein
LLDHSASGLTEWGNFRSASERDEIRIGPIAVILVLFNRVVGVVTTPANVRQAERRVYRVAEELLS